MDDAITNGVALLAHYQGDVNVSLESMIAKLTVNSDLNLALVEFENARKQSTLEAYQLAKWDASEWLSRLYVVLSIAVKYDLRYQDKIDMFMNNNFIAEVLSASKTGDLPAKMRNSALELMEITELFTQQQLSILATVKAPLSCMWQEVPHTTNENQNQSINIEYKSTNNLSNV